MKWKDRRRSSNVNRGGKAPLAVGGVGGLVLMLVLYFLGFDPSVVNNGNQQISPNTQIESQEVSKERETLEDFLSLQKNLIKNILITLYRIHYEGIKRNKDREEPPGGFRW